MSNRGIPVLLMATLAAGLWGRVPAAREAPTLVVSLQRTACFGACPQYTVSLFDDGTVAYEGVRFVKVRGKGSARLGPGEVAAVREAFSKAGFSAFADRYDRRQVTDHPSVRLTFAAEGRSKSVDHYLGDRSAPETLTRLEEDLDRLLHAERWVGTEAERNRLREDAASRHVHEW